MNRFIGLIITVVAVAALIGAAIGWRFPFLGGSGRGGNSSLLSQDQSGRRAQPLNNNQPGTTTQNNNPANPQPADDIDPEASNAQPSTTSGGAPPAAMW
ncbi:MAG TPA: hypothetical protein V6D14_20175 [Coleofasciculaceae cyanobacterium]